MLRTDRLNCFRKIIWVTVAFELVLVVFGTLIMLNLPAVLTIALGGLWVITFVNCWQLIYLTAWGRWLLARTGLPLCRRLPWQIMTFLDDARRRGVLRQIGGVYEFRHARLRDSLARADKTKRSAA